MQPARAVRTPSTITPDGRHDHGRRSRQSQAMDGAPAAARKLVGSSVQIVQREEWRGGDTGTGADFAMEIPGKPGHLKGGDHAGRQR